MKIKATDKTLVLCLNLINFLTELTLSTTYESETILAKKGYNDEFILLNEPYLECEKSYKFDNDECYLYG